MSTEPDWLKRLDECSQARYGKGIEPSNDDLQIAVAWVRAAREDLAAWQSTWEDKMHMPRSSYTDALLGGEVPG